MKSIRQNVLNVAGQYLLLYFYSTLLESMFLLKHVYMVKFQSFQQFFLISFHIKISFDEL